MPTPYSGDVIRLGDSVIGYENLAVIVGTAVLCLLIWLFFRFTRIGIAMQAASQNQLAAFYVGIPVKAMYSLVWGLSAAIAAIAGILTAPVSLVDPLIGFVGIKAFAAAIVGATSTRHISENLRVFEFELTDDDNLLIDSVLKNRSGPGGDCFDLERDMTGRHGQIMRYNQNDLT